MKLMRKKNYWPLAITVIVFALLAFYLGWLDNGPRPLF